MRCRTSPRSCDDGFTLIEVMMVVVVIAILMMIAIPTFLSVRSRAAAKAAESNLRNAVTDEQAYYSQQQGVSFGPAALLVNYSVDRAMSFVSAWPSPRPDIYVHPTTDAAGQPAVLIGTLSVNGRSYWAYDDNGALTYATTSGAAPTSFPLPLRSWP